MCFMLKTWLAGRKKILNLSFRLTENDIENYMQGRNVGKTIRG